MQNIAKHIVNRLEKRAGERLRRMMIELSQTCTDAIISADSKGIITTWNPSATRIFGWQANEAIGKGLDLIVPPRFFKAHSAGFNRRMQGGSAKLGANNEVPGLHRDGHEVPIEVSMTVLCGDTPESGVGAIIRDISDRRKSEEHIRWLAHYDSLTKIPNRTSLQLDLASTLAKVNVDDNNSFFVFALLDLDGFKEVNDSLGHSVGDVLLQQVSSRIVDEIDSIGQAYRFGGDEFAVILHNTDNESNVLLDLARLRQTISTPFEIDQTLININASIGYVIVPIDAITPDDLITNADLALYESKKHNSITCRYTQDLRTSILSRRKMDSDLRQAVQNNEFELYYQPQQDHHTGQWTGAEVLLRWNHPSCGILAPAVFMEALESSSLAVQLGHWIITTACLQAKKWCEAGLRFKHVGINLFASQLRLPSFVEDVKDIIATTQVDPQCIEFEITERIALSNDDTPIKILNALKAMGIKLAFDDFGTGYASLSALKRYPIDRLKIDRVFVQGLPNISSDGAIVSSIIAIAKAFGMDIVAEGIETPEQGDFLAERHCNILQGYLYGKPMTASDFEVKAFEHLA